ncbi:hypothetical protein A0H81_02035 [Grifola frondosa]|uniref:DUF6534 domain-containing protein n=1 Tax=Grifola frondosa TaxID=5627 RepID=A0A1C7MLS8_GRIFR|nr:hypothetical protein A0H81_02035 [Grifola frondosa]
MFVRRVWRMSRGNKPLTVFLAAISLMDLVCGITITIKAYHVTFAGLNNLRVLLYLNFASGFSGDACVALSLCYYLYTSRTGFGKTDTLIYVLILYTVNTGLITALDASLGLITYVAMPKSFVFVSFYFLLSKLYVNAFLASLNARGSLRMRTEDVVSINLSRMSQSRMNFADPTLTAGSQQPTVGKHVDTPQISVSQVDMEEYKPCVITQRSPEQPSPNPSFPLAHNLLCILLAFVLSMASILQHVFCLII